MRRRLVIALAALAAAGQAAPAAASVRRGLPFGAASGHRLRLDLYGSDEVSATQAPVIVWIHGGGFFEGTRAEIGAYADEFARRGYLSLSIDYRLHTESFVTHGGYRRAAIDAQHDAQAAVRWVRRHAASLGADTTRVSATSSASSACSVASFRPSPAGSQIGCPPMGDTERRRRRLARFWIFAGIMHFVIPRQYEETVPPPLDRWKREIVAISGVAEIAGGLAVRPERTRHFARWWLLATLVGVYPANIYMAVRAERFPQIPRVLLWARLPVQALFAWRIWRGTE